MCTTCPPKNTMPSSNIGTVRVTAMSYVWRHFYSLKLRDEKKKKFQLLCKDYATLQKVVRVNNNNNKYKHVMHLCVCTCNQERTSIQEEYIQTGDSLLYLNTNRHITKCGSTDNRRATLLKITNKTKDVGSLHHSKIFLER